MSSIYKDGKYYKAALDDGRRVHLGTPEAIVKKLALIDGFIKIQDKVKERPYLENEQAYQLGREIGKRFREEYDNLL